MRRSMTTRSGVEAALAALFAGLFVFTIAVPDWIEVVFHIDPDGGNGAIEVMLCAGLGLAALALATASAIERWRGRANPRSVPPHSSDHEG
ncbi:MAG: hypothetical protein ACRDMV_22640 [Streptosporangiales bacterium]